MDKKMKYFLFLCICPFSLLNACLVQYIDPSENQMNKDEIKVALYSYKLSTFKDKQASADQSENLLELISKNEDANERISIMSSFSFSNLEFRTNYLKMIFKGLHYKRSTKQLFLPGLEATIIAHYKSSLKKNYAEDISKNSELKTSWPQRNIKLFSCLLGLSSCAATLGAQWVYKIWKHKKLIA